MSEESIKPCFMILWFNKISLLSLFGILSFLLKAKGNIQIYFADISFSSRWLLRIFRIPLKKISPELANYKQGKVSLGDEWFYLVIKMTSSILQKLKRDEHYQAFSFLSFFEKIDTYFERQIRKDIGDAVQLFLIIQWHKEKNGFHKHILFYPYFPCGFYLRELFLESSVHLEFFGKCIFYYSYLLRSFVEFCFRKTMAFRNISFGSNVFSDKPQVAVHYGEGLNTQKRSDIFWCVESKFPPERIVIYFDSSKEFSYKDMCSQIEAMGMKWICLARFKGIKSVMKNRDLLKSISLQEFHMPIPINKKFQPSFFLRDWITQMIQFLCLDVKRWEALYRLANIKVVFDIDEMPVSGVAQVIALDRLGGIRIGIQRSILFSRGTHWLNYSSNHLFFASTLDVKNRLEISPLIQDVLILGYLFDYAFNKYKENSMVETLKANGAIFTLTLYDNIYFSKSHYSRKMMTAFLKKFMEWVIEDKQVGIILKEKKPAHLNRLSELKSLLIQVQATGRFLRIPGARGYFPFRASRGTHMAVGIGISSAVVEAILAGAKGIHYDVAHCHYLSMYQWGYEKVVFDDLDRLGVALKWYKENPSNESALGDWTGHHDEFDPYRDGKAAYRMGMYIQWLMQHFEQGKSAEEAKKYANLSFAQLWGKDKWIATMHDPLPAMREYL